MKPVRTDQQGPIPFLNTHLNTHKHLHTHTHTHTHMHTCMDTWTSTHIRRHTHRHAHRQTQYQKWSQTRTQTNTISKMITVCANWSLLIYKKKKIATDFKKKQNSEVVTSPLWDYPESGINTYLPVSLTATKICSAIKRSTITKTYTNKRHYNHQALVVDNIKVYLSFSGSFPSYITAHTNKCKHSSTHSTFSHR